MELKPVTLEVDGINIAGQLYLPGSDMSYPAVCACHGIPAGIPDPTDRGYSSLADLTIKALGIILQMGGSRIY